MDDEEIVQAKAREMAEILFEHHEPKVKEEIMEHFRAGVEERVRAFYAETGEWPAFKRDPYGRGLTMGTQAEIDRLPPPPRPPISEEARRIGREDQELRDALRRAFCRTDPEFQEMFAKRQGITAEELTEREVDACVDAGGGEAFRLYHAKHGRHPDHTETNDAANLSRKEWDNIWKTLLAYG